MDIKRKLLFAFMIMIMFSCTMMLTVTVLIMNYQANVMEETYDVETDVLQILLSTPVQILNQLTKDIYNDLITVAKNNPDVLLEADFVEEINTRLQEKSSFLVIRQHTEVVFFGDEIMYKKIKI